MQALGRPSTAAGVASLYAGLIDAMVVDEGDPDPPPAEIPTLAAPTLMEGAAGRARVARIVLDYAASLDRGLKATAVLPVKRFAAAKQRLAAGIDDERRAALVAAMLEDVLEAIGAARSIERTIVVTGEPVRRRAGASRRAPRCCPTPPTGGHSERGAGRNRHAPRPPGPSASCSSPATARCSTRASSEHLLTGVPDALRRDRPRPPRHRDQRPRPGATRRDPPGLRRGQLRPPRRRRPRGRRPLRGRGAAPRWRSTSTPRPTSSPSRARWRPTAAAHGEPPRPWAYEPSCEVQYPVEGLPEIEDGDAELAS